MPSMIPEPPLRLAPEASLWRSADGFVIVVDEQEQFAALDIEEGAAEELLAGRVPSGTSDLERWPRLGQALRGLLEGGYVVQAAPRTEVTCAVIGEDPVAQVLRDVLGSRIAVPAGHPSSSGPLRIRVCRMPRQPHAEGTEPFLPVLLEGAGIGIGPWTPAGADDPEDPAPGLDDLRERRLAAHPVPALLEELWENAPSLPAHRGARPSRACAAVAAGWLLQELETGGRTLAGHQVLVSTDLQVTHHPVLPWPRAADPHPARPAPLDLGMVPAMGQPA